MRQAGAERVVCSYYQGKALEERNTTTMASKTTATAASLSSPQTRKDARNAADVALQAGGTNPAKPHRAVKPGRGISGVGQATGKGPAAQKTTDKPGPTAPPMKPAQAPPAGHGFTPEQLAALAALMAQQGKGTPGKRGRKARPRPNLPALWEQLQAIGTDKLLPGAMFSVRGVYDTDKDTVYLCVVLVGVSDDNYPQAYIAGVKGAPGVMERAKACQTFAKLANVASGVDYLDRGPGHSWITLEWEAVPGRKGQDSTGEES